MLYEKRKVPEMKKNGKREVSRREFLKGASAAAAAFSFPYFVPSSALGKAGTVSPSNRIVMGAIGVGGMGTGDLRGFLSKSEVQMVAVCDVDRSHCENAKKITDKRYGNNDCKIYGDYREMLANEKLDAVQHALPDQWHGVVSVACARAGLDIYGQKPLSRTVKEGRAICDAVERYGIIWQTGSWQRSVYNFYRACELVRNNRIGKIKYVEVGLPDGHKYYPYKFIPVPKGLNWDMWLGPAPWRRYSDFGRGSCHFDWRWIMDYSGGQLTDWAGHHIDIAHWGLGFDRIGPVEVEGKGEYPGDGLYDTPYAYDIHCVYPNGLKMRIANQSKLPMGMGPVWYGDKGWIHVSRRGLWASDPKILKETIGPNDIHLYRSTDHKQNFLDCVKSRKETITPARIAHNSIRVALIGEIAMRMGRKLHFDPDKEVFVGDDQANQLLARGMRSPWTCG